MRLRVGIARRGRRGTALLVVLVLTTMLAVLAGAGLMFNQAKKNEVVSARDRNRALYLAEAGLAEALSELMTAASTKKPKPQKVGDPDGPHVRRSGIYWADVVDNGDKTFTVTATGEVNGIQRRLQSVLRLATTGAFNSAIYAGNSSGDPAYTLKFGGSGVQADHIEGDIFSGGNIAVTGDAELTGEVGAVGTVTGTDGEEGISLPIPDMAGMDFETNHDYDVAAMFDSGDATWRSDDAGGSAWQLPTNNPGHIFRKNPDDRASEIATTAKDDYFLEDPYERVQADSGNDGSQAYEISFTGTSANRKVFFIDGNLWLHNYRTASLKVKSSNQDGTQVTFVVKGNVYFSDNLFYDDPTLDGIAFLAIKDPAVADSGNIYLGDPEFGTLNYVASYMYAENNFYDYNLDAAGSAEVTIYGNMTAGNQVSIERDYGDQHSALTVLFDGRLAQGLVQLPGIPQSAATDSDLAVLAWRELPLD